MNIAREYGVDKGQDAEGGDKGGMAWGIAKGSIR